MYKIILFFYVSGYLLLLIQNFIKLIDANDIKKINLRFKFILLLKI